MPTAEPGRPRILLVDDDAAVAKALAAILTHAGYTMTVASGPREAEGLLDERFDGLILDLRMPEMRGDALYYLASARQPWLTNRTLFVTGDMSAHAEAIVRGTTCPILIKPFGRGELQACLSTLVPLLPTERDRSDRAG